MTSNQPIQLRGVLFIREFHRNELAHLPDKNRGIIPPNRWNPYGYLHTIWDENGPIKLPDGTTLTTMSRALAEILIADFEVQSTLDATDINLYSVHATCQVNAAKIEQLGRNELRQDLMYDKCFQYSHPPEQIDKYTRFSALKSFLTEHDIEPFTLDINDFINSDTLEFEAAAYETQLPIQFKDVVDAVYNEFRTLSVAEKVVAITLATESGGCFLYGILTVLGRCSMLEFFRATMAANQLVAEVYGDVSREDYIDAFTKRKGIFLSLRDYMNAAMIEEEQLWSDKLKYQSWFQSMPHKSQTLLLGAVRILTKKELKDYSVVVMNLGKAVEIALKLKVFSPFKEAQFYRDPRIEVVDDRGKARLLGRYVDKAEAPLGLGEMIFILNLKGGKTEKSEPLLEKFFIHCDTLVCLPRVADKLLLKRLQELCNQRNKAAHYEIFSDLAQVETLFEQTCELLDELFSAP